MAILDADKEGFLRSKRSLIQTCGRASRNVRGQVIMYADKITDAMKAAMKAGDKDRLKVVRLIMAAIKQVEVEIIDRAFEERWVVPQIPSVKTGKRVAVIGSGDGAVWSARAHRHGDTLRGAKQVGQHRHVVPLGILEQQRRTGHVRDGGRAVRVWVTNG